MFKFLNGLVSLRLRWALDNYDDLNRAALEGHAVFGTLDTFILSRYTVSSARRFSFTISSLNLIHRSYIEG